MPEDLRSPISKLMRSAQSFKIRDLDYKLYELLNTHVTKRLIDRGIFANEREVRDFTELASKDDKVQKEGLKPNYSEHAEKIRLDPRYRFIYQLWGVRMNILFSLGSATNRTRLDRLLLQYVEVVKEGIGLQPGELELLVAEKLIELGVESRVVFEEYSRLITDSRRFPRPEEQEFIAKYRPPTNEPKMPGEVVRFPERQKIK